MNQRLSHYPPQNQNLNSFFLSTICTGVAVAIASLYCYMLPESSDVIPLLFLLSTIIVARYTANRWYSLGCCIFSAVYFYILFPLFHRAFSLFDYSVTFLTMVIITLFVSDMSSHLAAQKKAIAEREKQLYEREQETMRANLLRAISHDLRTPLTGIIGNSALLLENSEALTEEAKRNFLSNIHEDSNWLLNMVENLLTITRIQGDNLSITTDEEPVEEVVSEALQKLSKRYPDAQINAKIPDEFLLIPMDAILIEQVAINLLSNAILYSQSTRPVDLIVRNTPHAVIFTVRDYGVGLPPDKLNTLFDGNTVSPSQASDSYKGMGIGLSICKTIIAAHHGTLTARNHGEGAEFIFTLPKN